MGKAARNPATGLTKKQDEFCFQTVILGHPNRAYRVAYESAGMSDAAVRVEVWKLLRDPKIEDRIAEFQAIAEKKLAVSIERIAKELARIGFSDIGDLFDDRGNPIPLHLLSEDVRRAVQSVTLVERRGAMAIKVDVPKDATKDEKRGAKSVAREAAKADAESVNGIEWVPVREKKVTLFPKQPALDTMAKWKRMIDQKTEDVDDPNDVRSLTDEQLEQQLKASQAALKTIDGARKRSGARTPTKAV